MTKIKVVPETALMDDEVDINITEADPNSAVTVSASIVHFDILYLGFGHFYCDSYGSLNVKDQISYGGTFRGLHPMGLFSSMRAMPSKLASPRLIVRGSVEKTLSFEIMVWKGHLTQDQLHQLNVKYASFGTSAPVTSFHNKFILANCLLKRTYLSSNVQRIPIRVEVDKEQICGVLFVPKGTGPFPGVIDMFGIDGGCVEIRAALLAKHGFASLALAYFNYDGLKAKTFTQVELSYFDKAIKWMSNLPLVKPNGIAMVGWSLGARAAMLSSCKNANVICTVCINSTYYMASDPDVTTLEVSTIVTPCEELEIWRGHMASVFGMKYEKPRPLLRHEHDNPTMFMIGELDLYRSAMEQVVEQWQKSGKKNVSKVIIEGQGHFIEPPYAPMCTVTTAFKSGTTKSKDQYKCLKDNLLQEWGGDYEKHGKGQLDAWNIVLEFLRKSFRDCQQSKL